ncbi:MAG: DUF4270 family protein [Algoriphagus aquaeductus]|uniref:DUF4270 family protein n=1 Tax=Algoriphagus aquaeductus TaxID=475299 RepID=UPI003879EAAF
MKSVLKKSSKLTTNFTGFIPALRAKFTFSALLITTLFLGACSDPATVGLELAPQNNQIGVFYKEFTLDAQVVLLDSFNTTNAGVLVVGNEEDSYFGKTASEAYTRLYIEQGAERPRTEAILDSIFFTLSTVSVNGSDLDKPKKYSVHLLTEPIQDTSYYNFSKLAFQANPIAEGEMVFKDSKDTLIKLPLVEDFTNELFTKLKRGQEFDNLFAFRRFLPGVVIKGREGDNTTAGFSQGGNTGIFVYYHYEGDTAVKKYSISTFSSRSFNSVDSDRSGTPTEVIAEYQKSYDTGPIVGMKSGLGLALRIDTSPIGEFLDTLQGVIFNQVNFSLGPIVDQDANNVPISTMIMKLVDSQNRVLLSSFNGAELNVQGDAQVQVLDDGKGNLIPNYTFLSSALVEYSSANKIYRSGISSHVNAVFRGQLQRQDWLLYAFTPRDGSDDFKRSLRQFKVNKNNIKVTAIYSKTR